MGSWTKHFVDGSSYVATDEDIEAKRASWRRSRLTGINCVELEHNNTRLRIYGLGEYWQSDTMEVVFPEGSPRITKRRIMKQIEPEDLYFHYQIYPSGVDVSFVKNAVGKAQLVPPSYVGKWFVLELHPREKIVSHYYRSEAE